MRKVIGVFMLSLLVISIYAQDINQKNVPAVVLNAFQLEFSNATDVKWKLDKGNFLVRFKVNYKSNKVVINEKGVILRHNQDLYVSEIPKPVLQTIKSRVEYYDVNDASKLTEGDKITYHIRFRFNGEEFNFWVDDKGQLLKLRQELKDSEIPEAIMSQIIAKYGVLDVEHAKFVEEPEQSIYIIRGEINDMYHYFRFDEKSNLLRHDQDLRNSEIPVEVLNAARAAYPGYEIRDADLLEEGKKVNYKLQLRKSKEKVYVYFSSKGKILKVK
jgi:hypothetical protein